MPLPPSGSPLLPASRPGWRGLVVGCLLGLACILTAWLPGHMTLSRFLTLESRALDRDLGRMTATLQAEEQVLEAYARDWAVWDDTCRFLRTGDPAYRQANLTWSSLVTVNHIHLLVFLHLDGRVAWSGFRTQPEGPDLPLPAWLQRPDLGTPGQPDSGILLTDAGPLIVAIQPILPTNGQGPRHGTLVMGRLLDESAVSNLARRCALPLRLVDLRQLSTFSPEARRLSASPLGQPQLTRGADRILAELRLQDLDGLGSLVLTLPWERDILHQGRRAAISLSLTIAAALIALGGLTLAGFLRFRRLTQRNDEELRHLVDLRTAELQAANAALEEISMSDPLTGLKNRRFITAALPSDTARVLRIFRGTGTPPRIPPGVSEDIVFLLVDLDHFKDVNDTHGHAAGDAILAQAAQLLRGACRTSDTLARWGGEEFLIAAKRTHRAYAPVIAAHIVETFRLHTFHLPDGGTIRLTCSVGWCPFPFLGGMPEALSWDQAVELADLCLYAVKRSGRNGWAGLTVPESSSLPLLARHLPGRAMDMVDQGLLGVESSFGERGRISWR